MATAKQPSKIDDLAAQITTSGLAFSNRYEVLINTPPVLNKEESGVKPEFIRSMTIRCDSITIPGRSFSTTPFRFYGPARNMPYEQIYSGEVTMTFILSEDLRERDFFENWMKGVSRSTDYKFEYYSNYTTTMEIDVLSRDDESLYKIILEEVYPKLIGDIQVGYDKDNDFMRQDVTMCFRKYTTTYIGRQPKPEQQGNPVPPTNTQSQQTPPNPNNILNALGKRAMAIGKTVVSGKFTNLIRTRSTTAKNG